MKSTVSLDKEIYYVEGMDGSGKSNLIQMMAQNWKQTMGDRVELLRHPSMNTMMGRVLRQTFKDKSFYGLDEVSREMMFTLDRYQNITESLHNHDVVFCDRFRSSSYIPTEDQYDVDLQIRRLKIEMTAYDYPIFGTYLYCEPEVAYERIALRDEGKHTIFETVDLLKKQKRISLNSQIN